MKKTSSIAAVAILSASPAFTAEDAELGFHEDYYVGFSQGAYYGLMLAGEDYDVAWCMKAELEVEAPQLGTGGEFQAGLESILQSCRDEFAPVEDQPAEF